MQSQSNTILISSCTTSTVRDALYHIISYQYQRVLVIYFQPVKAIETEGARETQQLSRPYDLAISNHAVSILVVLISYYYERGEVDCRSVSSSAELCKQKRYLSFNQQITFAMATHRISLLSSLSSSMIVSLVSQSQTSRPQIYETITGRRYPWGDLHQMCFLPIRREKIT